MKNKLGFWLTAALISAGASQAQVAAPDQASFNIFHPVPDSMMRELCPDRPDKTESPFTLDAGHYQLEMDFANFTYDKADGTTTRAWNVAPFNLKAGLTHDIDFQLVFDNYEHVRTDDHIAGLTTVQSGVGDLTTRLKINLWGNDGGKTAFGLLPYIKFPTSTDGLGNNEIEGGLIFPLDIKLPGDFDLGLETAVACLHDAQGSNDHADYINSIALDHVLIGKLSGYLEFFSDISTENHSGWVGTVDIGLEFLVSENVQFDCGCNFGVTPAADDFNPFAGITVRF